MDWLVVTIGNFHHVVPDGDVAPHEVVQKCWCGTKIDPEDDQVIIHQTFDPEHNEGEQPSQPCH